MEDLDFKEKKIVGELLAYFGRDDVTPTDEMAGLVDYAARNTESNSNSKTGEEGGTAD